MRTSISLPGDLVSAADALATRLGVSRSELCAIAVAEYVARHDVSEVETRLDQVYATECGALDPRIRRAQIRSLGESSW